MNSLDLVSTVHFSSSNGGCGDAQDGRADQAAGGGYERCAVGDGRGSGPGKPGKSRTAHRSQHSGPQAGGGGIGAGGESFSDGRGGGEHSESDRDVHDSAAGDGSDLVFEGQD